MWVLVTLFSLTLIEIALFILVGGWLTLWPTLALVVILPMIGTYLARLQGLGVMMDLGGSLQSMRRPASAIAHGPMIMLAGLLFLIPGFFTDALGFLLLVPPLRQALIAAFAQRMAGKMRQNGAEDGFDGQQQHRRGVIIDAEYHEIDPDPRKNPGQSGWTQD